MQLSIIIQNGTLESPDQRKKGFDAKFKQTLLMTLLLTSTHSISIALTSEKSEP